ncbi:universal stress protein [Halorubrum vacuolatum]|uniref:Nucleotide-binding universal stress protein, UspA family n=1 Tax=Halorubrum vacuolatum TaxID=63740 RepID=A0A238XLA7_HALVU|nr:universal stress protein [Halorubrum vacuolatum]SNR59358.1 Nucleotide-binding universal stress protein, UspA family [Halorubrum vacuolatum]
MTERVLVPVDGSSRSMEALEYAIAMYPDAAITLYHVIESGQGDIGALSGITGNIPDEEAAMTHAEEVLSTASERATELGATVETARGRGRPDRLIVKEAGEGEYDLVVIGSHGRDGVARVLMGSVAEKVARRSPVPVLIYR